MKGVSTATLKTSMLALILPLVAVLQVACGDSEQGKESMTAPPAESAMPRDDSGADRDGDSEPGQYDLFAEAEIGPVDGSGVSGIVRFDQRGSVLEISGEVSGLTPGRHGLHLHETGDCSGAGAKSAGAHFSPEGHSHGSPESPDSGHHAGDLGNIVADGDGNVDFELADEELRLGTGENAVNGLAVVIHENADDYEIQPDGGSGAAVGCAVIDPVPQPDYVPGSL